MATDLKIAAPLSFAASLHAAIETEAASIVVGEVNLSRRCAKLGRLLSTLKLNEGWRELGHSSFNSYLLTLRDKYNRSAQRLHLYVSVAEKLLPLIGDEGLERIGVTKAIEITTLANRAKRSIPPELIAAALDEKNGISEIRALAHQLLELAPGEQVKGRYQDFGGAYLDDEEQKTFKEAVLVTLRYLGISKETPDWLKRKRVIIAWAQEFLGAYIADVYGVDHHEDI